MAGSRSLRKIQLGKESGGTAGTPVAATTIWRGMGVIHDIQEVIFPEEDVGILGGTDRSYIGRYWSEITFDSIEATFEQLPYICEAGIAIEVPTQDGAGSGYIYNYLAPTTTANTIETYTVEGGDNQQAEEFDYAFVKSFNLSGTGQGALMMSADWQGRQTTNSTFTGALTIPAVEEVIVNDGKLYIDDDTGTVGDTVVSSTLFGIDLAWSTGLNAYWAVDGSKDFNIAKFTADEIILSLNYEHNASAVTEKAKYRAGSTRLIRLIFEGSDLATAGVYSKKTLIIDLAGVYEDWSALEDSDGNDTVTATVRCRYSRVDTLKAEITIVNELTTLP